MKYPTFKPTQTFSGNAGRWWILAILLFSLLPEGLPVTLAGRTPQVFLFDPLILGVTGYLLVSFFLGGFVFDFSEKRVHLLALAFIFAHLVSLLFNYRDVARSILAIKVSLFGYLTYLIAASVIRSRSDWRKAHYTILLWGTTLGSLILIGFVMDWSSIIIAQASYEVKEEIGISVGRSNFLAALLVPIFPIAIAEMLSRRGYLRALLGIPVAIMTFSLLVTMSKGAFVALLLGSLCTLPLMVRAGLKARHVLAFAALATCFLLVLPADLLSANYEMFLYRWENPEFIGRFDLWKVAWDAFLDNPVTGVGANSIYIYNRQYAVDVLYTHNFVLNFLAELGLIGALPFFFLLIVLLNRGFRLCLSTSWDPGTKFSSIGIFTGLVCTLLHGLVEPTFPAQHYSALFWAFSAVLLLSSRFQKQRTAT